MKTNSTLPCANNECVNCNETATTCCCRACNNKMSSNAARIVNLQRGEAKLAEFLATVSQPKCKNPDCNNLCYKVPRYWKWSTYCSKKCQNKCGFLLKFPKTDEQKEIIKNKKIQTSLKNYGVEHPLQSPIIKQKIKDTILETYGVEHAGQIESGKIKRIQTCIQRYGEISPCKNQEVKQKQKETMLARYGVEHTLQHKEFHDKMKQTNIERYGSDAEQKFIFHFPQYKEILRKLDDHQPMGMTWMVECPTESNSYVPLLNSTMYNHTGVINNDRKS